MFSTGLDCLLKHSTSIQNGEITNGVSCLSLNSSEQQFQHTHSSCCLSISSAISLFICTQWPWYHSAKILHSREKLLVRDRPQPTKLQIVSFSNFSISNYKCKTNVKTNTINRGDWQLQRPKAFTINANININIILSQTPRRPHPLPLHFLCVCPFWRVFLFFVCFVRFLPTKTTHPPLSVSYRI